MIYLSPEDGEPSSSSSSSSSSGDGSSSSGTSSSSSDSGSSEEESARDEADGGNADGDLGDAEAPNQPRLLEYEPVDPGDLLDFNDEIDIDAIAPPPSDDGEPEQENDEDPAQWRFPRRRRARVVRSESKTKCMAFFTLSLLKSVTIGTDTPWPGFIPVPSPMFLTVPRTKEFDHLDWSAAKGSEISKILERGSLAPPIASSWVRQTQNDAIIGRLFCIENVKHPGSDDEAAKARYVFQGSHMRSPTGAKMSGKDVVQMALIDRYLPAGSFEMRCVLHLSKLKGWRALKFDIKSAYLWSTMPETLNVYVQTDAETMRIICGLMEWEVPTHSALFPMVSPIYGFVISGDLWANLLKDVLSKPGWSMLSSLEDHVTQVTFYVHYVDGDLDGALAIATDDGALTGTEEVLAAVMAALSDHFEFRELAAFSENERMLGATYNDVTHDDGSSSLFTDMRAYLNSMSERVVSDAGDPPFAKLKFAATPGTSAFINGTAINPEDDKKESIFRSSAARHVGGFAFAAYGSEWDIAYSVNFLSRYLNDWCFPQDTLLWMLTRYLKHEPRSELVRVDHVDPRDHGELSWFCFCDADLGGDPATRRSTSGYVVLIVGRHGTRIVAYTKVKRQGVVSTNTCEAEVNALSDLVRWLLGHYAFLSMIYGVPVGEYICSDASAAIAAVTKGYSVKLAYLTKKSYALTLAFLREQISNMLLKWPTYHQVADILTKHLDSPSHWHHLLFSCLMQPASLEHRCPCFCKQAFFSGEGGIRCTQMVASAGEKCVLCLSGCKCPCWCGVDDKDVIFERAPFIRKRFKSKALEGSYNAYGNGQPTPSTKRVRAPSDDVPPVAIVPGSAVPAAVPRGYPAISPPSVPVFTPKRGPVSRARRVAAGNAPPPRRLAILVRRCFASWVQQVERVISERAARGQRARDKYRGHVHIIRSLVRALDTDGVEQYSDVVKIIKAAKAAGVTFKSIGQYTNVSVDFISDLFHDNLAGPKYAKAAGKVLEGLNREYIEGLLRADASESGESDDSLMLV